MIYGELTLHAENPEEIQKATGGLIQARNVMPSKDSKYKYTAKIKCDDDMVRRLFRSAIDSDLKDGLRG